MHGGSLTTRFVCTRSKVPSGSLNSLSLSHLFQSEYFAMVNFVKPQLLGTLNEFKNRFVNPIQNGQHSDSTDRDVRVMKKRSFVLNDLLKGCMQRSGWMC